MHIVSHNNSSLFETNVNNNALFGNKDNGKTILLTSINKNTNSLFGQNNNRTCNINGEVTLEEKNKNGLFGEIDNPLFGNNNKKNKSLFENTTSFFAQSNTVIS